MKERILRLSGAFELTVVLLLAFGLTVPGNLLALLSPTYLAQRTTPPVNNAALVGTLVYELVIMCILIPFLKARGWTRERLGFLPTIQDTVWGVGLLGAYYVIVLVFESILGSVWPPFDACVAAQPRDSAHGPDRLGGGGCARLRAPCAACSLRPP